MIPNCRLWCHTIELNPCHVFNIGKKNVTLQRTTKRCNVVLLYVSYMPSQRWSTSDAHPASFGNLMRSQLVYRSKWPHSFTGILNVSSVLTDILHVSSVLTDITHSQSLSTTLSTFWHSQRRYYLLAFSTTLSTFRHSQRPLICTKSHNTSQLPDPTYPTVPAILFPGLFGPGRGY